MTASNILNLIAIMRFVYRRGYESLRIECCAHDMYYNFKYNSQQERAPPKPGVYTKPDTSNL